jgi:hypothetical protein
MGDQEYNGTDLIGSEVLEMLAIILSSETKEEADAMFAARAPDGVDGKGEG